MDTLWGVNARQSTSNVCCGGSVHVCSLSAGARGAGLCGQRVGSVQPECGQSASVVRAVCCGAAAEYEQCMAECGPIVSRVLDKRPVGLGAECRGHMGRVHAVSVQSGCLAVCGRNARRVPAECEHRSGRPDHSASSVLWMLGGVRAVCGQPASRVLVVWGLDARRFPAVCGQCEVSVRVEWEASAGSLENPSVRGRTVCGLLTSRVGAV